MSEAATRRVERTRRDAIKRGLALVGLAGAATSGKLAVDSAPAGASEVDGSGRRDGSHGRSFGGRNVDASGPGLLRGTLPGRGDRLVITGDLLDPSGAVVGELFGSYLQLVPFGQAGPADPTSLQEHMLSFADGSIHGRGLGVANLDAADVFAIIGATGRYAGVTGSYLAVVRFLSLGGDGTAQFTVTTNPEGPHNGGS